MEQFCILVIKKKRDHTRYNDGIYTACMTYGRGKRKRVQHHVTWPRWDSLSIIILWLRNCMHFTTAMPFCDSYWLKRMALTMQHRGGIIPVMSKTQAPVTAQHSFFLNKQIPLPNYTHNNYTSFSFMFIVFAICSFNLKCHSFFFPCTEVFPCFFLSCKANARV
jgi:hypothetical protein